MSPTDPEMFSVYVVSSSRTFVFWTRLDETVQSFRYNLSRYLNAPHVDDFSLGFRHNLMKNDRATMQDHGVKAGATIDLIPKVPTRVSPY